MFVPVWTSRQVRTADCYKIVTARRRLLRNRFLSSSVCMSDLAWRRTAQAHRPIRSVGRTSASTNQKCRAQAHRPIRSVGHKRIDQSETSSKDSTSFSANQIHRTDILRRIYKIGWSESYRPIRSHGQLLNRYIMVTFFGECDHDITVQ